MAVRGMCLCAYAYNKIQLYCAHVCMHISVYLFFLDMDIGSWLPADGFIQVEYKH